MDDFKMELPFLVDQDATRLYHCQRDKKQISALVIKKIIKNRRTNILFLNLLEYAEKIEFDGEGNENLKNRRVRR